MYSTEMTMPVSEWIAIPENPIQRDTVEHAKRAINGHLRKYSETHRRVAMAVLSSGERYKLDGHTRALLWEDGRLESPATVKVDVYHVDTIADVEDLYKQFDNDGAVETASDRLRGAFRLHKHLPVSTLLRHGGLTSALAVLTKRRGKRMNIYAEIGPWMPAIKLIDAAGFSNQEFPTGIYSALLLTIRIYGESAIEFWRKYANDEGYKDGKIRCPVQMLRELVRDRRLTQSLGGEGNIKEMCAKAISCFEAYRQERNFKIGVKETDLEKYIERNIKEIRIAA